MPAMPMVAALSASHLAALVLPPGLERLYIACDSDLAGRRACEHLAERARAGGAVVLPLHPRGGDFNDDLRTHGREALSAALRAQMATDDLPCGDRIPAGESEGA
jgi:DNA primase